MRTKLLIYLLPVLLVSFMLYGYSTLDEPNAVNLSASQEFIESNTANPPVTPFTLGDSCSGTGQEKHDDGSFENGIGWNATVTDGAFCLKFRPASYPWKYNKFCLGLTRLAAGADSLVFDVVLYDSTGPGGTPGNVLGTLANQVARSIPVYPLFSWNSYDISSIAGNIVNSGAIYIGYRYDGAPVGQASKYAMYDQTVTSTLWPGYAKNAAANPWVRIDSLSATFAAYKCFAMRTMGQVAGPPPPVGNTLVLVHDTTVASTTQRKADRDTLNKYLGGFIGSYTMKGFDTNTVLPDLTPYNTIILQETSFDAIALRYLGAGARNQIKAWLLTGTVSNKKALISIGADQAYNYSRSGSGGRDLDFAETYGKYIYRVDNGPTTISPSTIGVTIDAGNSRLLTSAPPGAGFYPDGCSMIAGGSSALYRYQNHTVADTLGGIGNIQPGYVVATIFQDPRYFISDFKQVFAATINWVKANGGLITGTGNNTALTIAESFALSQNYPNPFNPSTTINYTIPNSGLVTLKVFDIIGKEVASLVNGMVTAGSHSVNFNASKLSSGVYFYRIESGNFVDTKKMFLLK